MQKESKLSHVLQIDWIVLESRKRIGNLAKVFRVARYSLPASVIPMASIAFGAEVDVS